jgi:hypothetical protein
MVCSSATAEYNLIGGGVWCLNMCATLTMLGGRGMPCLQCSCLSSVQHDIHETLVYSSGTNHCRSSSQGFSVLSVNIFLYSGVIR